MNYEKSCGAVVYCQKDSDIKYLLVCEHSGFWVFPKGHMDAGETEKQTALRELQEETGVKHAALVSEDIISLETLTVSGHVKRGRHVPSHLHFNLTFLAEAEETETLMIKADENQAVKWWTFEDALKVSSEPWMVDRIYKKLIAKSK